MKKFLVLIMFLICMSCSNTNSIYLDDVKSIKTDYGTFEKYMADSFGTTTNNLKWYVEGSTSDGFITVVEFGKTKAYVPVHKNGDYIQIYFYEIWYE